MPNIKRHIPILLFAAAATLFVGMAYTASDFLTAPAHAIKDRLILFFQWFTIVIGIFPVFYFLSVNKYIFALTYPLICTLSGVLTYFKYTAGTVFTTMILDAALDNDTKISQELISFWLISVILLSLLIGVGFVVYRFRKIRMVPYSIVHALVALLWMGLFFQIPRVVRPMTERIPMNLYFIPQRYFSEKKTALTYREALPCTVSCPPDKPLVVLVLGESWG